jgi:hypothetical protein
MDNKMPDNIFSTLKFVILYNINASLCKDPQNNYLFDEKMKWRIPPQKCISRSLMAD